MNRHLKPIKQLAIFSATFAPQGFKKDEKSLPVFLVAEKYLTMKIVNENKYLIF